MSKIDEIINYSDSEICTKTTSQCLRFNGRFSVPLNSICHHRTAITNIKIYIKITSKHKLTLIDLLKNNPFKIVEISSCYVINQWCSQYFYIDSFLNPELYSSTNVDENTYLLTIDLNIKYFIPVIFTNDTVGFPSYSPNILFEFEHKSKFTKNMYDNLLEVGVIITANKLNVDILNNLQNNYIYDEAKQIYFTDHNIYDWDVIKSKHGINMYLSKNCSFIVFGLDTMYDGEFIKINIISSVDLIINNTKYKINKYDEDFELFFKNKPTVPNIGIINLHKIRQKLNIDNIFFCSICINIKDVNYSNLTLFAYTYEDRYVYYDMINWYSIIKAQKY